MRGSIYYQTGQLTKVIFEEGAKKHDKNCDLSESYQKVSSFTTMETYRRTWNNFGIFLRDEYDIKNFEKVTSEHIEGYMLSKVDALKSKQYLEKISSALGKLGIALELFNQKVKGKYVSFDFSIRQEVLNHIRSEELVYDGYHNRAYQEPTVIIENLTSKKHQLAAQIQLCSGCRFEGIGFMRKSQLKGLSFDTVTKSDVWIVETKEKGGKVGEIYLTHELYLELQEYILVDGFFKIDYQEYAKDIRSTCKFLDIKPEGTHAFRWCFAQNRIKEYQVNSYTYDQALLGVSQEMKHNRISISEHYAYTS